MTFNLVELAAEAGGNFPVYDQPCKYASHVEGHGMYCHNTDWKDAPRKCKRGWYSKIFSTESPPQITAPFEDCEGFEKNERN